MAQEWQENITAVKKVPAGWEIMDYTGRVFLFQSAWGTEPKPGDVVGYQGEPTASTIEIKSVGDQPIEQTVQTRQENPDTRREFRWGKMK
jgi:hypothetical protein